MSVNKSEIITNPISQTNNINNKQKDLNKSSIMSKDPKNIISKNINNIYNKEEKKEILLKKKINSSDSEEYEDAEDSFCKESQGYKSFIIKNNNLKKNENNNNTSNISNSMKLNNPNKKELMLILML